MELTEGAVEALEKGARVGGENVNAIGIDDETGEEVRFVAGQIEAEKHGVPRKWVNPEFQPVLEVKRIEWFGRNLCSYPMIKFWCTDAGDRDEICVMASPRKGHVFARQIFSKRGIYKQGKLGVGRRFQLLDFTTIVVPKDRVHCGEKAVVHIEKIKCEPKPKRQTKMVGFLASNNRRLQGDMSGGAKKIGDKGEE